MARPDDLRLRWHRTTLDGQVAFYGEAGDGPPVVFFHGWGLTARSYARTLPKIAATGARVIAPALPGFGKSEPFDGEYTFEKLAGWVDELLEHIGVDEAAALVGHSFGGGVATATAWHHPDRARSLVLVNSIGGSVWKTGGRRGDRTLADRPLWDWGLRLPGEFRRPDYRRVLPVVVRDLVGNALSNPRAVWRAAELARTADLRDELATLAERGLPVSIVWGSEDSVVPEATFLSLCEAAGAPGDIIEDAGHSWLLTDPDGFGELVTNSLAVQRTLAERTAATARTTGTDAEPADAGARRRRPARRRASCRVDASTSLPPRPAVHDDRVWTDVAVVGAGIAGLYAAVNLPRDLDVVIIDKGAPGGASGSSPWAQGGLAAAIAPDDSPERHAADTIAAGDGLCDPVAVEQLTREAPRHIDALLELGAEFDRGPDGALELAREGGQALARSVRRADATGAEVVRVLRDAAGARVTRLSGIVRALGLDDSGRVSGLWVHSDGRLVGVGARAVLLATGGCGGLYAATTNPDQATGDGLVLAAEAGAAVRDVEFVQFHPTGLAAEGSWRFLLTEALRGAGATLHDRQGRRFLVDRHPDAELAPRHVVAKAILDQPGGIAYLDATHLREEVLTREFPTVLAGARRHGFDLAAERVPVTPAAHYQVGGIRTDLDGRTSLRRLYAVGEVASTGVHGANRLAGNSLSESLVFGARAAVVVAAELPSEQAGLGPMPGHGQLPPDDPGKLRHELRTAMLRDAGPVRSGTGLAALDGWLAKLEDRLGPPAAVPEAIELHHAVRAARLIAWGARLRTESRGGHWREDHPGAESSWAGVHLERTGLVGTT